MGRGVKIPRPGRHKYNPPPWRPEPEPFLSERYIAEIDASLRKAEKAWKAAEAAARRAEKQAEKQPTTPNILRRDDLRALVLARLDELRRVEQLMRPVATTTKDRVRIVNKGRTL
ncbi:MAG: hypothetical protein NVSMB60_30240 [Mycobacterium sp.]